MPRPDRRQMVRRGMCRLKHVLSERAHGAPDPALRAELLAFVNNL